MYSFLAKLDAKQTVLDLGCGNGSFHYEAYECQTIATDLHLPVEIPERRKGKVQYIQSDSNSIPLAAGCVDAVVCHNTLEHFPDYKETLSEVGRVLRPSGWLWIAVPNGFGFDDALYRYVFEGGGHVNRFTFDGLISDVRQFAGLELLQTCDLFSSFIFLRKPTPQEAQGYPRTAHFLANIPDGFSAGGVLALNVATRVIDRLGGTRYSQYGWGFLFSRGAMQPGQLPSYFNVCRQCGSGCPANQIRRRTGRPYKCPHCGELNVFVKPPRGLD